MHLPSRPALLGPALARIGWVQGRFLVGKLYLPFFHVLTHLLVDLVSDSDSGIDRGGAKEVWVVVDDGEGVAVLGNRLTLTVVESG
jgi:hypothetical protein